MSRSPTFDETNDSLRKVCDEAQKGLYRLGQIRGRNDLQSEKELRFFVLATSKFILERLPCLQLEEDVIESLDSKYCHTLNKFMEGLEGDPEALSCQDQADKGLCGECIEPCDVRDGKGVE
ncbi:MAG: hypothetical protein WCP70_15325 [Methanothrix sp.]